MRSLLILITVCFVLSSADSAVNWTVDDNTLPESLPDLMRVNNYRNEEIQNALFWAYKIQYDVISEHIGRVYDAESPLEYFNDVLILPKTRTSLINSNFVFENNTVSGLMSLKSNNVIIRWSQDRVTTDITWKELHIVGRYTFVDEWRYVTGKYKITVENVMYQNDTPLSKNIELYPSSAPNSAISYSKFKTTFTGHNFSIPDGFLATRYFLEEVAFGHIADYALEVTRKNVTSAIRAAIQPYVQYRNRSDSHFPPTAGWLDDGRFFAIIVPFVDGLDKALQKVNSVWTEPNTGALMVTVEHTLHNINGTFNLHVVSRLSELQQPSRVIDFFMDRVRLSITYDVLRPNCLCSAIVKVYKITSQPRDTQDDTGHLPIVATAFANAVKDHLSNGSCSAIAKTNKYGTNPC
ncbi:PREDICTED: uncharacterized protein LOC107168690 [Diuraphis noxia]|uniref:uncharacterized protein LOC107168690 n=1 Tax=Diuraphis noxia TaxID=143948 RepID=UPI0007637D76|nr:PREDICTED: uncharacterized protein LOC107168690 [Diuraphis noxia]